MLDKVGSIGFDMANSELLPYVARDLRSTINKSAWDAMGLVVAESVERWFDQALEGARSAKEIGRGADNEIDLAGR